jgi:CrcB protein
MNGADLVLAFVGGGIGSLIRWGIGEALAARLRGPFPWATFLINVSGAFLIGFLTVLFRFEWTERFGHPINTIILTGMLGGYTTFSSMQLDTSRLLRSGRSHLALGCLVGTAVAGLASAWIGGKVAGLVAGGA